MVRCSVCFGSGALPRPMDLFLILRAEGRRKPPSLKSQADCDKFSTGSTIISLSITTPCTKVLQRRPRRPRGPCLGLLLLGLQLGGGGLRHRLGNDADSTRSTLGNPKLGLLRRISGRDAFKAREYHAEKKKEKKRGGCRACLFSNLSLFYLMCFCFTAPKGRTTI